LLPLPTGCRQCCAHPPDDSRERAQLLVAARLTIRPSIIAVSTVAAAMCCATTTSSKWFLLVILKPLPLTSMQPVNPRLRASTAISSPLSARSRALLEEARDGIVARMRSRLLAGLL
jgi:hypothetical protein